jgi:hypothetical protein
MEAQFHAISYEARRKAFWPSIAVASAQLRSVRREREKPGDPAVARLSSPGAISVRRPFGGVR